MILTIIIAALMMLFLVKISVYGFDFPEVALYLFISIVLGLFLTVLTSAGYGAYDSNYEVYNQEKLYSLNKIDGTNYLIISTEDKVTKYYLDIQKEPINQTFVISSSHIKSVENCTNGQPVILLNHYRYKNRFMPWFIFDLGKNDDYTIVVDKKLITTR